MALLSATGARLDVVGPLAGYNFWITLIPSTGAPSGQRVSRDALSTAKQWISAGLNTVQNMALGGFSECSGLEMSLDVEEYQEGGNNGRVHKFPTRVTWSNIRLRRGVSISDDLWNWHYAFVEGKGQRRDGIITLQNDMHIPFKVWHFYGGLPVRWIGPSLDAAQSQIAIEELEIAHQGIRLYAPSATLDRFTGVSF